MSPNSGPRQQVRNQWTTKFVKKGPCTTTWRICETTISKPASHEGHSASGYLPPPPSSLPRSPVLPAIKTNKERGIKQRFMFPSLLVCAQHILDTTDTIDIINIFYGFSVFFAFFILKNVVKIYISMNIQVSGEKHSYVMYHRRFLLM